MATEIDRPMKAKGMTHKLIGDTAKGMALEHWEQLAKNNNFFKLWPDPDEFQRQKWPLYVDIAKQTLIGMLGNPKLPAEQAELIHDVILRDGAVNPKKMATPAKPSFFLK